MGECFLLRASLIPPVCNLGPGPWRTEQHGLTRYRGGDGPKWTWVPGFPSGQDFSLLRYATWGSKIPVRAGYLGHHKKSHHVLLLGEPFWWSPLPGMGREGKKRSCPTLNRPRAEQEQTVAPVTEPKVPKFLWPKAKKTLFIYWNSYVPLLGFLPWFASSSGTSETGCTGKHQVSACSMSQPFTCFTFNPSGDAVLGFWGHNRNSLGTEKFQFPLPQGNSKPRNNTRFFQSCN